MKFYFPPALAGGNFKEWEFGFSIMAPSFVPNLGQSEKINSPLDQMTQTAANFTKTNKDTNNEYTAQIIKPQ